MRLFYFYIISSSFIQLINFFKKKMNYKHFTYDLTVAFLSFVLSLFFREMRPRGSHRIPKEGPVIFVVAPHANQVSKPRKKKTVLYIFISLFFLVC